MKMFIVSILLSFASAASAAYFIPISCTGKTFYLQGGGSSIHLYYSDLVNLRRLRKVGTNQCVEAVNPYSWRWAACSNYVGQRFGTISNSLCGSYKTAVTSHLNGRAWTREDGWKFYPYTGRASQLWSLVRAS